MQDNSRRTTRNTREPSEHEPARSGNRCGHDPASPRHFEPPPDHQQRPSVIRRFIDRVRGYFHTPEKIPSLAGAHHARKVAAAPEGDHKPPRKVRKVRSERREACCSLLGAIAHYCDLPTLCLSVPQPDGSMLAIPMQTLADRAGLSLRRAERAMRDIREGGLLTSHQRAEQKPDGTYRGRAAIRVVPQSVFGLFGLEEQLKHDRKRVSQKRTKERYEGTRTGQARLRTAVGGMLNKLTGDQQPRTPQTAAAADPQAPDCELKQPPGPLGPHTTYIEQMLETLGAKPKPQQPAPAANSGDSTSDAADDQAAGTRSGNKDPP